MRHYRRDTIHDRAVSEALGFIIIFGIMLTGIGLVALYGYPVLVQEQQNSNIRNMERNMIVLQSDFNSLTVKSVPYKETMMQVAGGTLMVAKEPDPIHPYFEVTRDGVTTLLQFFPGELKYISDNGDAVIVTENGAVHKRYYSSPGGSVMISEPRWFYDEPTQTFVMSFIRVNASNNLAQTGIGTVSMKIVDSDEKIEDVTGSTIRVHYSANPEDNYNVAWKNYFSKQDLKMTPETVTGFDSTFSLNSNVNRLIIKTYSVSILSL